MSRCVILSACPVSPALAAALRPDDTVAPTASARHARKCGCKDVTTARGDSPARRRANSACPAEYARQPDPASFRTIVGHAGVGHASASFSARACREGTAADRTCEVVARKRCATRREASYRDAVRTGVPETTDSTRPVLSLTSRRVRSIIHPSTRAPEKRTRTRQPTTAWSRSESGMT